MAYLAAQEREREGCKGGRGRTGAGGGGEGAAPGGGRGGDAL